MTSPQAYVVLVYLAVTTRRPKYIAFCSCLGGVFLLIAYNVLVRNVNVCMYVDHIYNFKLPVECSGAIKIFKSRIRMDSSTY